MVNKNRFLVKALVIASGVFIGLLGAVLLLFGLYKLEVHKQEKEEMEKFKVEAVNNNFLHIIFPKLQKHMEEEFDIHIVQKYNVFHNVTPFEQPLDDEFKLSFFELSDNSELENEDKRMYTELLSKLYVNATIKEIYDYPSELKQMPRYKEPFSVKYPTDIYMNGLSKVEDGNSSEVNNQIRGSIILFLNGYLGLKNLSQVTLSPTEEETLHHAFILDVGQDTKYQFSYGYNAQKGELNYVIVERV